jgi:hypothetical protein
MAFGAKTKRRESAIFISYRREDSAGYAGRLCEHLGAIFGADRVFMDVEDIQPGDDFTERIEDTISGCGVLVAIIGPRWLPSFQTRQKGDDFVTSEIAEALRRGITVIPLLVGSAAMPRSADLPESLAALARHQAVELRDSRFDDDLKVLVDALRSRIHAAGTIARRSLLWKAALAAGIIGAAAAGVFFATRKTAIDISGVWVAEMQRTGQRPYRIRLELVETAGKLTGAVSYPTGDGTVHDGIVQGPNVTFSTTHTPQFESEPVVTRYSGSIVENEIRLVCTYRDGVARGVARRRASE